MLPAQPKQSDLETGFNIRGAQIGECDAKRRLAVETHDIEHGLEAKLEAIRAERAKPWYQFWPTKRVAAGSNK
jgi:hypothetical protein